MGAAGGASWCVTCRDPEQCVLSQACPQGCHSTFGCQLEPSGSSRPALSGAGSLGGHTEPFSRGCVLPAGLCSGCLCCSTSISALSAAGGAQRGQQPQTGGPSGEGVWELGWIWTARRAEQSLLWMCPAEAVSALEPSPRSFSSIICRGCSRESSQCCVRGLPVHPKRLGNAETIRDFPNCALAPQLPLGEG